MKVSIIDLRYKTSEIMKALDRNESITILYHEKVKGILKPARKKSKLKVTEHPLFGVYRKSGISVLAELKDLRKSRHDL